MDGFAHPISHHVGPHIELWRAHSLCHDSRFARIKCADDPTCAGRIARCDLPALVDPRLVTAADYAELRALESAKDEARADAARQLVDSANATPVTRNWPHRWPEAPPPAGPITTEPAPAPVHIKGRYLDLYA